jgi:hypothetical protein
MRMASEGLAAGHEYSGPPVIRSVDRHGQRKALRIAVSNNKTQRRYSGLLEALTSV